MRFYKNFIRTFNDLPGYTTLLIHSLSGCLFHCFGCHNYDEIVAQTPIEYKTKEDLYMYLEKSGFLLDAIMFSGGEFLIDQIEDIQDLLEQVRTHFEGEIIVTTCGVYNNKVKYLFENELVDGIHIDMKLPYHALDVKEDQQIFKDIMGITPTKKLVDNLLDSVNTVIQHNSQLDQIRTVKYPILSDGFFDEIESYVNEQKAHFNSDVPYFLNDFLYG